MTFTAIASDLSLFNPSVMISQGVTRLDVAKLMRRKQEAGLYCPHCYQRSHELIPVRFRNTESKRVHFFHPKDVEQGKECSHYKGETEKHLAAKAAIAETLKSRGLIDLSIDQRMLVSPGVTWRKPDILVTYPNTVVEAHEVQISSITSDAIAERTADLKAHGVANVIWYLYGSVYNLENRAKLQSLGVECYHLWFDGGDDCPRWQPDTGIPKASNRSPNEGGVDDCSKKFSRREWKPSIGDVVHKRHNLGWTGKVTELVDSKTVKVLWHLEQYPNTFSITDLRPNESDFEGYRSQKTR